MITRTPRIGDHVVVTRDIHGWLGSISAPTLKRGTRAIVRADAHTFLTRRYTIETTNGHRHTVHADALRPAAFGNGEASWERYKKNRSGIRLGLALLNIPVAIALIRYYLAGGTTEDLLAALPVAILASLIDLAHGLIHTIGLPLTIVALALVVAVRRIAQR